MRKAVIIVVGGVATLVLLWGVLHVMITPVNPAQEPPDPHYGGACGMCHIVTEGADLIE